MPGRSAVWSRPHATRPLRTLEPISPPLHDDAPAAALQRVTVRGKFLFAGDEKFYVKGVTYGTFAVDGNGRENFEPAVVEADFARIAASGCNAIRTYTVPPAWLLDLAARYGLRVMVGLPWEQHVAFLEDRALLRRIERRVREAVVRCAGHPAVLCFSIGNEIPAPIVRWFGRKPVERFLERLCRIVREADPNALVTYVNYPSTEYLDLPFLDFACYNVYLESRERLTAYLARLQNLSADRPVVLAEIGLDSRRNGELEQARVLDWQLRTAFAAGCAGALVFAWTDEWHRGGHAIEDWDFGLTRRDRSPKPALAAVQSAFADAPFPAQATWPKISIVVCAYNAQRTMHECLEGVRALDYPDFETIVIDDGSTDETRAIAAEFDVRLISTENRGLSSARNTGLAAATGEIVAYLDSDAYPDRDWLRWMALAFAGTEYAGVGGPNLAPPGGTRSAECFDHAPGGPVHVLLTDRDAEHLPGCNMAFRRRDLVAIGGFDPQLRIAGDDVDICWRLLETRRPLGFAPAMLVWHHRRTTLGSYLRQQRGYGRAEALLERKWPEKYNALGHATWAGRIYAKSLAGLGFRAQRVYSGVWGLAPYQRLESKPPTLLASLAATPEWYIVITALALAAACGTLWKPLLVAVPLLVVALVPPLVEALSAARRVRFKRPSIGTLRRFALRSFVGFLQVVQPPARLWGRIEYGLTSLRGKADAPLMFARPRRYRFWSEAWHSPQSWLSSLEEAVRRATPATRRGEAFDRFDLHVQSGLFGSAKLLMTLEEHGSGNQLARYRAWPSPSAAWCVLAVAAAVFALLAWVDGAWIACALLATFTLSVAYRTACECAAAMEQFDRALTWPSGLPRDRAGDLPPSSIDQETGT